MWISNTTLDITHKQVCFPQNQINQIFIEIYKS